MPTELIPFREAAQAQEFAPVVATRLGPIFEAAVKAKELEDARAREKVEARRELLLEQLKGSS